MEEEEVETEKEDGEVSSGNTIIYGVIIFIELNYSLRLQLKGMTIRRPTRNYLFIFLQVIFVKISTKV